MNFSKLPALVESTVCPTKFLITISLISDLAETVRISLTGFG